MAVTPSTMTPGDERTPSESLSTPLHTEQSPENFGTDAVPHAGHITVPVVNMAGDKVTSVTLGPDDLAARLHSAVVEAIGGRPCRLVLACGSELQETLPVTKSGLSNGIPVTVVIHKGVYLILSTKKAFAALKSDGCVVAWGDAD
jgi:hypothetical protein